MSSKRNEIIEWLLQGDASVRYQVARDLLQEEKNALHRSRQEIHQSGWCKRLIDLWDPVSKRWGGGVYSPKWISTTYTMLDLKNFCLDPSLDCYQQAATLLIEELPVDQRPKSKYPLDLCICGMLLNLCCYGTLDHPGINPIVDVLLDYHMKDGGWNCSLDQNPQHSSLHTTMNVLEGLLEYERNGYTYRLDELQAAVEKAHQFILCHRLYKSDKTGQVIKKSFTMLSYPPRWRYDVLRALDYFRYAGVPYDERMDDALTLLLGKRRKDGTWPVQQKYPGLIHFDYEKTGGSSRINTVRALRVLAYYDRMSFSDTD